MKALLNILFVFVMTFAVAQFPASLEEDFQEALEQVGQSTDVIGLSVAVRNDNSLWTGIYGNSTAEDTLTTEHLFAMGSVSKTITAATIMAMSEDGLVDLDDPLSDYLPTMPFVTPTATIRQLLQHTSGIFNYTDNDAFWYDVFVNSNAVLSDQDVIDNYLGNTSFDVGTDWGYSNTNYVLLGMIIRQVSGNDYWVEARNRFGFDNNYPSLVIPPFEVDTDSLAHLWMDIGAGVEDIQESSFDLTSTFSGAGAAGAYASTPTDLSQWALDLYGGALLNTQSMSEMLSTTSISPQYGLGTMLLENPLCAIDIVGHTGGIFYSSTTFYHPSLDFVISAHTNDAGNNTVPTQIFFDLGCIYEEFITSVSENEFASGLSIYPNPASDFVQIESSNKSVDLIQLFDNSGRLVQELRPSNGNMMRLNVSYYESGLYHLRFLSADEIYTARLIVD